VWQAAHSWLCFDGMSRGGRWPLSSCAAVRVGTPKASSEVAVAAQRTGNSLLITIEDDGPGIAPERRSAALTRGTRLDESAPGSGLGLHIVAELAGLCGDTLALDDSALGGLRVRLSLPAASVPTAAA
jgi:signal transduction histidine kinase